MPKPNDCEVISFGADQSAEERKRRAIFTNIQESFGHVQVEVSHILRVLLHQCRQERLDIKIKAQVKLQDKCAHLFLFFTHTSVIWGKPKEQGLIKQLSVIIFLFTFVSLLKRTHTSIIHSLVTLLLMAYYKADMEEAKTTLICALPLSRPIYPCVRVSVLAMFLESCPLRFQHGLLPSSHHSNVTFSGSPFLTTLFKTAALSTCNIPNSSSLFYFSPEHLSPTNILYFTYLFCLLLI